MLKRFTTSASATVNEARRKVQRLVPETDASVWVVGGAVRDSVWGIEPQHDVDLFFPSKEDLEAVERIMLASGAELLSLTTKKTSYRWAGRKYDLIGSWFDTLEAALERADFTVACAGVAPVERVLVCHEDYFEDLAGKQLRIHSLPDPASTLMRVARYSKMGFTLSYGDAMRLAKRIREADALEESGDADSEDEESPEEAGR